MNYNEYLAFLLLYAADIDQQIKEEEKEIILKIVEQSEYKEIKKNFNKLNDYERIRLIQKHKAEFITTEEKKEEVFKNLKSIFLANDEYMAVERAVFMYLRKML